MLALGLVAPWSPAEAKQRAGLAKLDQVTTPGASVKCGARRGDPAGPEGNTFTYHVTVKNVGADTNVIVRYLDATQESYPILAGAVLHFSGVGGSTNGVDRVIEVTGDPGSQLVGTMSALFDTGAQQHPYIPGPGLCAAVAPAP
jgi:hypothetical protein